MQENWHAPTRAEIALQVRFKSANAAEEHWKPSRKGVIDIYPDITVFKVNVPLEWQLEELRFTIDVVLPPVNLFFGRPEHVEGHYKVDRIYLSPVLIFAESRVVWVWKILAYLMCDYSPSAPHLRRTQGQVVVARVEDWSDG